MVDRRSAAITIILTPLVVVLMTIAWFRSNDNLRNAIGNEAPPVESDPGTDLPAPSKNSKIVAGYFVNWGIYDRNYNVIDVAANADKLTHILYAFANVMADGSIVLGDDWADKDKHFDAEQTVNHKKDDWNEVGNNLYGNLKQFYLLKQQHRHLKVSLSIGGWSWSTNFSAVASSPTARSQFTSDAAQFVRDFGFDGIDIDWEMPKNDKDAVSYVALLRELRQTLDNENAESPYLISVAVPCGPEDYKKLHLAEMATSVDLFYLMAYDFAGGWDEVTGHQSAIYGKKLGAKTAIDYYIKSGVPAEKLVLGIPAYGRGFSHTDGLGAPFKGVPEGSWEPGSYDYKVLPRKGAIEYVDETAMASYSYDPKLREFVTYDNVQIATAKCKLADDLGLGGVMFWELSQDYPTTDKRSLLGAAADYFDGRLDSTLNHIHYPNSQFDNIA